MQCVKQVSLTKAHVKEKTLKIAIVKEERQGMWSG